MPEGVVHLRPTAPLRRVETIDRAIGAFIRRPDVDSLRAVTVAEQTPYKMWFIGADDCLEPVMPTIGYVEAYNMPRQALPRVYWQNGYIDITRPRVVRAGSMTGSRILGFVIDEPCIEIDYEDHLHMAEQLLASLPAAAPRATDRFPS